MEILIGTSGYSYTDWIGPVYPPGTQKGEMLSFYTSLFSYVELNFSYYRMPAPSILKPMADKTPADFRFGIKAHQSLTHQRSPEWQAESRAFISGISPLQESGKLSLVLAQFPFSFHYTEENRRYLAGLCDIFRDIPLGVEFRNSQWISEKVFRELEERGIGFIITDSPDLRGLPGPVLFASGPFVYLRFHGRNKENWWQGDATSRYDYLYTEEELKEWVPKILLLAQKNKILYIAFNNHHKGQAVKNASTLKKLIAADYSGKIPK